jgi:DNA-binding MarR family transcriptional regulator
MSLPSRTRGLIESSADPEDGRRLPVSLIRTGQQLAEKPH